MDNEQLLTNGICPKCYRPLYESKHTDKILCDCGIMAQPMDRLKETRKGSKELIIEWLDNLLEWQDINEGIYIALRGLLNSSLAESYNLGRDEAQIELLEELLANCRGLSVGKYPAQRIIEDKLTSLKEKK